MSEQFFSAVAQKIQAIQVKYEPEIIEVTYTNHKPEVQNPKQEKLLWKITCFLEGTDMKVGQSLYLLKRHGVMAKVLVERLENISGGSITSAYEGSTAVIVISFITDLLDEQPEWNRVDIGDVLSSEPSVPSGDKDIRNPRLKALFREKKHTTIPQFFGIIFEEIAMNGRFLSVMNQIEPMNADDVKSEISSTPTKTTANATPKKVTFPMLTSNSGDVFFPVFTDEEEAKGLPDCADKKRIGANLDFYNQLFSQPTPAKGIVINPFSDNVVISGDVIHKLYENKCKEMEAIGKSNDNQHRKGDKG